MNSNFVHIYGFEAGINRYIGMDRGYPCMCLEDIHRNTLLGRFILLPICL